MNAFVPSNFTEIRKRLKRIKDSNEGVDRRLLEETNGDCEKEKAEVV